MIIAIIAAVSRNRGIGKNGKLPWHISEDLRRFKKLTMGHAVVMGRRTGARSHNRSPGRRNVVLTRTPVDGVETYGSLEEVLEALRAVRSAFSSSGVVKCTPGSSRAPTNCI